MILEPTKTTSNNRTSTSRHAITRTNINQEYELAKKNIRLAAKLHKLWNNNNPQHQAQHTQQPTTETTTTTVITLNTNTTS